MSSMSKIITNKLNFFLLCLIFFIPSISQSSQKLENFKNYNWIEDIPFLSSLIENKRDVVEFDSSNGKIISISFNVKNLSKKQIFSHYSKFFEEKNWYKYDNKYIWEMKSKRFKKKIFKIENFHDNILTIKIIIENF